jgi:hypothetical protein
MKIRLEVLGRTQERVLRKLGPVLAIEHFYLGGGTAVALHLGHRRSLDLDWFTGEKFGDPLLRGVQERGIPLVVRQIDRGTVHGVRVSLLEYRYACLREAVRPPGLAVSIASLPDLAAMKLAAVAQRGAKKDFVDLYALAPRFIPLSRMVGYYQRKYGTLNVGHLLYSLTYFDEAEGERMPQMLWRTDWRTIKKALRGWVADLAR